MGFGVDDNDDVRLKGATDLTIIGNIGDRLRVSPSLDNTSYNVFPSAITAAKVLPIGYGATVTVPAFPGVKPLGVYQVPVGTKYHLLGVAYKTSSTTTYLHVSLRTVMWKFAATALTAPATPTLAGRTITGSGLTLLATYRYKTVAQNTIGNSAASAEATITLTTTQNAVTLTQTTLATATHYDIYRTAANGLTNTEVFVGSFVTDAAGSLVFVDTVPDSQLGTDAVPAATTTSGSVAGAAYPTNYGASHVLIDTIAAITTVTPLDIIYKNIYGEQLYQTATPGAAVGSQTAIAQREYVNPASDNRQNAKSKKFLFDIGIQSIVAVGNLPASGSFIIYGRKSVFQVSSKQANGWETVYMETPVTFSEGEEIIFGVSGNTAATTATRNDITLIGILE